MSARSENKDLRRMLDERDEVIEYLLKRLDLNVQYHADVFGSYGYDLYGPVNSLVFEVLLEDIRSVAEERKATEAKIRLGEK